MPESILQLQAWLDRLGRRERGLRLGEAGAWACVGLGVALLVLTWAYTAGHLAPGGGRAWVVVAAALGLLAALPGLSGGWSARERRRQARRVEALRPELDGALLTVVDRAERPQGSPALLRRLADRVQPLAVAVPAGEVVPAVGVQRAALAAGLTWLGVLAAGAWGPVPPFAALAAIWNPVVASSPSTPVADAGPRAVVGDLTLRYLYPTYTKLEPLEVPNSSGEVHAPPGTRVEVRARTAVPYDAAVLEVYSLPPVPVELTEGRDLATAFDVTGPGVWRFRFGELPSPDYPIVIDPDLPPDVALDANRRSVSLAVDTPLPFAWTARDDYGVTRVVVEVKQGGRAREVDLRVPLDAPRTLGEAARLTPRELGLSPGDRAILRVKAWDNDAVAGAKPGWSAAVDLEVLGPRGEQARIEAARVALRDALVRVLSPFLLEPTPAATEPAAGTAWAVSANDRYAAFDELVLETWGGDRGESADATAIDALNERRRALLAYARTLGSASGRATEKDLETLATLQQEHLGTLEDAILLFDRMARIAASRRVAELTRQVADEARELTQDLENLPRDEALARLDQVERLLRQLREEAARLGDANLQEFVNERLQSLDAMMEEARKALAEGREEEAREMLRRIAEQLEDLARSLQDQGGRAQQEADRTGEAMEALQKEMAALEQEQRQLREDTEAARERFGGDLDEAMRAWEEVERRSRLVAEQLNTQEGRSAAAGLPSSARLDVSDAADSAEGLHDSARARDLESALGRASALGDDLAWAAAQAQRLAPRAGDVPAAGDVAAELGRQRAEVTRIRQLLERMAEQQSTSSPQLQEALRQTADAQRQIQERADRAAEQADQLADRLPMRAPGLEDGAKQGAEQAGRAEEAMREGDAMGAEGGQRAAEDGFRRAQEALRQAQQDLQSMQQAGRPERGREGESGGQGGEQADGDQGGDIALPAPEEFQTPEEYRRALLEGMSGEVPEEYRSLNRRYYEELVRQ